jgi:hypothetical protein
MVVRRPVNSIVIPLRILKTLTSARLVAIVRRAALVVVQMLLVDARRALPFLGYRKPVARYNPRAG